MAETEQAPGSTGGAALPTILVVASDVKLLKLLDMALSLEMGCAVLTLDNSSSAVTAAQRIVPDLLILDEHLLDRRAADLGAQLHRLLGLERVPTLLLNAEMPPQHESQSYPIRFLSRSWKMEEFYAAVHALLDSSS
jgi:response regulator RpfG family c-di-GMP phosphodiesterase